MAAPLRHRDPRGGGCSPPTGTDDADIGKRMDEIWHAPGLRQRLVQRKQREPATRWCASSSTGTRPTRGSWSPWRRTSKVRVGQVEITGRVDRLERDSDGSGRDRRPQDRHDPARRRRAGPEPAARRLPAGRAARRVRAARADRAGRRGAGPGGQGRPDRQGAECSGSARWPTTPTRAGRSSLVETVAAGMSGPVFQATVNPGCRVCPVRRAARAPRRTAVTHDCGAARRPGQAQ